MPLAALVGSGINAISQMATNAQNAQLAEKQNDHEIKMWKMNNEYNSPTQQIARLREAGVNPASSFGQIASGSVSKSAPDVHRAEMKAPQVQLESFMNLAKDLRQLEAMKLDNESKAIQNHFAQIHGEQRTLLNGLQGTLMNNDINNKYGLLNWQRDLLEQQVNELKRKAEEYNSYTKEVNSIKLGNWREFGTDDAPWYLKTLNNFIDKLSKGKFKINLPAPDFSNLIPKWKR